MNLALLHLTQLVPIQCWSFESKSLIHIGRASDNDVIIYSAVVSHHHAELWKNSSGWMMVNFGANGTYVNDEPIIQTSVVDNMIIRLGISGPKLQIHTKQLASKFAKQMNKLSSKEIDIFNVFDNNELTNEDFTQTHIN
ncbi:MAG: FHA domain-containing protein [Okeania sp. SIO2G4]|uniref:FHA domain-containing protein n=1 Tax=unclassified Okeania TaxID=2634635 RepID=UPI0013B5E8DC|nr:MULTISPECIES: FHA domain-containing protein [unclassified Okeania]NEP42170.1 FHA domain-containing protein [Okeania sp. SIO2H7]NEP72105.1 FHA domain-containing protein [Okeania sp. SIO2G5]NEP92963.1 FHA domain-containing protein [Okeania sp. SIO2F5]NEQ91083.1 FHA domain-containing protein [Okeania sp. SIO2G4]